ncbi:hypothetical protein N7462_005276 [Penicillium macrosclerotiorum]|uniref:uncharacterized protein n=1 Tax=Penicillium macrosclerotiorum TaxID=303699 RepID=UPI0025469ED0|nr:uncharacterized protein N7462_005276 [Penicillium macrosclerotiorum]KAJ5690884.1 hypothetical protein N7462_005276 [Penicillium macrosclerotiorum]
MATRRTHTKITGAPDYNDPEFWNHRFATGRDACEWLNSGEALIDIVLSNLEHKPGFEGSTPRVLHLGPGISQLGVRLRDACHERQWAGNGIVVGSLPHPILSSQPLRCCGERGRTFNFFVQPSCLHCFCSQNADFSFEAVRLGREAERNHPPAKAMHWHQTDLLSWADVAALSCFAPFDVILDKSTSDAIATFDDQTFSASADHSQVSPVVQEILSRDVTVAMSPVELLALHLVPLTRKETTWIALSYSTIRFDNLPLLAEYWTLRSRTALKAPPGLVSSSAYAPEVYHWIYILDRK